MTPPFEAPYAGAELTPPIVAEIDVNVLMLPFVPAARCAPAVRDRKKVDFRFVSKLPVPGFLGHSVEGLPLEHARRQDQGDEIPSSVAVSRTRSAWAPRLVEVQPDRSVWPARQRLDDRSDGLDPQVHGTDTGADVGECSRRRLTDALRRAGHDDAVTLQPPTAAAAIHASTSPSSTGTAAPSGDSGRCRSSVDPHEVGSTD